MSDKTPIWRIKYLPKSLDEICGRLDIIDRLKNIINKRNFPHLLFVGSEGVGKTTIARLFAKEFLGTYYDANFKIVYADTPLSTEERKKARSDAYVSTSKIGSTAGKTMRSPAFIQIKVKPFVELKALGGVPFKILIVKNFEALGSDQQGFRRLMEIYGSNCRMILITTKISGIIDPIVSRCELFLISQVKYENFEQLILHIAEQESLQLEDKFIEILYKLSEGKISRAIDLLQLCSVKGSTIDMDRLYQNAMQFEKNLIRSLLVMCFKGDFKKARDLARKILSNYKFNAHEFFVNIIEFINKLPLSEYARARLINLIADADFRALDGRDDDIQISALLSKINVLAEYL
jgi:replication factor C small subunit